LPLTRDTAQLQLNAKGLFVNRLQESWAQDLMHLDRGGDDLLGKLVTVIHSDCP
jgi:hypothetical protein